MKHVNKILAGLITCCVILLFSGCIPRQGEKHDFSIGKGTFLLDGKPFVIKAAEIHYTRIPAEYWQHRIQMCKALGMNTICIYAFWNIHEQKPGEFDFKGQNDIAAFCRLAQKEGMYIMLRPGPYVCSEWEMGGLPWWLLKKEDIKLRTNDPYFLERTKLFMNEIGKQLADLQVTRGREYHHGTGRERVWGICYRQGVYRQYPRCGEGGRLYRCSFVPVRLELYFPVERFG